MLVVLSGIPGFDDGDLPRLVGILFGSLLLVNHVVSIESMTSAQLVHISPFGSIISRREICIQDTLCRILLGTNIWAFLWDRHPKLWDCF